MKEIASVDIQVSIVGKDYQQHYANLSIPAEALNRWPREERAPLAAAILAAISSAVPALFIEAESKRLKQEQDELAKMAAPPAPEAAKEEIPF